jgi:hypothetical protein
MAPFAVFVSAKLLQDLVRPAAAATARFGSLIAAVGGRRRHGVLFRLVHGSVDEQFVATSAYQRVLLVDARINVLKYYCYKYW